ncbi:MAG: hypothetical protein K2O18_13495 [Oscillospiraceae bacterium]|nr:hypothetical protein [Oscillospiraceae bacterium]
MVSLNKELAVIGTVNETLLQKLKPLINFDLVWEYSRMMEARSGYAVVNEFSREALERLLSSHEEFFQYDYLESASRGKPTYRIRIGADSSDMTPKQIARLTAKMMDKLDPVVNYPVDFLEEDMRLRNVLRSDSLV